MKSFSLSSNERIKSKKDFEDIFKHGNILFSFNKKVKASFIYIKEADDPGVKIAPAVSKRAGNAVWRNRIKRLIREAYRLNKTGLVSYCKSNHISLKIVFSLNYISKKTAPNLGLIDLTDSVKDLLNKVEKKLC
ncbi:MAG: ribonuclease P protein component [Bacteroidota bacterium]|nr:ribonuclease P protein component [Bacteroidota bacterium]